MSQPISLLALAQGFYFLITGVWPLISMRTFEAVTGPKTDDWLVKTVGVQIAVVGAVLLYSGYRGQVDDAISILAIGSASGLMAIDVWYVHRRVIPKIYLLDAAAELCLIGAWVAAWLLRGQS